MQKVKTSIVVVCYKAYKPLLKTLRNLRSIPNNIEIILVDNNLDNMLIDILSRVDTPHIKYIKSGKNVGYGEGNNIGISAAEGRYILVLNPDTEITVSQVNALSDFLDKNSGAAAVSPHVLHENGVDSSALGTRILTPIRAIFSMTIIHRLLPNNYIARDFIVRADGSRKPTKVEVLPGAACMIKKSALNEIGFYDRNLFLYFEESDIAMRLHNKGWETWVLQDIVCRHIGGGSSRSKKLKSIFIKSRTYYMHKHFGLLNTIFVELIARFSKWHGMLLVLLIFIILFCLILNIYL